MHAHSYKQVGEPDSTTPLCSASYLRNFRSRGKSTSKGWEIPVYSIYPLKITLCYTFEADIIPESISQFLGSFISQLCVEVEGDPP